MLEWLIDLHQFKSNRKSFPAVNYMYFNLLSTSETYLKDQPCRERWPICPECLLSGQVAPGLITDLFQEGKSSIIFRIEIKVTNIYPYLTDNEKSPVKNITNLLEIDFCSYRGS